MKIAANAPTSLPGDRPLRLRDRLLIALVALLGAGVLRLLRLSVSLRIVGEANVRQFWERGENVIVAFWHDRFLLLPFVYAGPKGVRVLVSSSRDGELIARAIEKLGLGTVRGSSTRGGELARTALLGALREGYDVGITPDGPRGPRHRLKPGVVELARRSGRPIIPLCMSSRWGQRLPTWDRFFIPIPFDSVVIGWGSPVWVSEGEDFEAARARIERSLNDWVNEIDRLTGNPEAA